MKFSTRIGNMKPSDIREIFKLLVDPEIISFAGGMPDPACFPMEAIGEASVRVFEDDGPTALQYTSTQGHPPLREKIAARMTGQGAKASADDVLILSGSQQGLDLCGKLFVDEGDAIICESPSYSGALDAFAYFMPKMIAVPTDDEGMDPEALERALETEDRVRLLYAIPDFQNPTGRTWSLERRKKILDLANRFDVPIMEDDPYSAFRFEGRSLPSLKSMDTQNRVIYLGTFSKTLCPGLRIGWAAAAPEILSRMEMAKSVSDIHANSLAMREMDKYLELFDLDDQIAKAGAVYKKRRDLMLQAMDKYLPPGCTYTRPQGGIFLWLELPDGIDAREVLLEAIKEKVAFVPGGGFYPNSPRENTIRLSYAAMPEERIIEGIQRLGRVLSQTLAQ